MSESIAQANQPLAMAFAKNAIEINDGVLFQLITVDVLNQLVVMGAINVSPLVQRAQPAWSFKFVDKFRNTLLIMALYGDSSCINPFILYKYHDDQLGPHETYTHLLLDGGNRTRSITHFIQGTYMDYGRKKGVIPPCCIMTNKDGIDEAIFFNNSELAKQYQRKTGKPSKVLTEEEQQKFLAIRLQTNIYTKRKEVPELGDKFVLIQTGVKVAGSDILKLTNCPFMEHFYQQNPTHQCNMIRALSQTNMNGDKFWSHWLTKMYLMVFPGDSLDFKYIFNLDDGTIATYIETNHPLLVYNETQFSSFNVMMTTFYDFISNIPVKISLPTFFACFYCLSTVKGVTTTTLLSHIRYFANHIAIDKIWVGRKNIASGLTYTNQEVTEEFVRCYNVLSQYTTIYEEPKRKNFPQATRTICENRVFGDNDTALCPVGCGNRIGKRANNKSKYVMGHIIAHAHGGSSTVENIMPICAPCNRDMRDEDMRAYQSRCYPTARPIGDWMESLRLSECDTDDEEEVDV
jgi:5-methylcytosine-specific restriction endonuclease McrA